jgi:16S rRNA (guanine966-N2)-methyltransferase
MRIASGFLRNMPLVSPAGDLTRPTSDKIRQAVLNSLLGRLDGAHVLDMFAGTGAMGLEAISRGAGSCTFVEADRRALAALNANIKEARRRFESQNIQPPEVEVISASLPLDPSRLPHSHFDFIWLDPPYATAVELFAQLLPQIAVSLRSDGTVAVESERSDQEQLVAIVGGSVPALVHEKSKSYGRTGVTTWRKIS